MEASLPITISVFSAPDILGKLLVSGCIWPWHKFGLQNRQAYNREREIQRKSASGGTIRRKRTKQEGVMAIMSIGDGRRAPTVTNFEIVKLWSRGAGQSSSLPQHQIARQRFFHTSPQNSRGALREESCYHPSICF